MTRSTTGSRRRRLLATVPVALALVLSACGGGGGAAAEGGATCAHPLTFWSWVPNLDKTVALFEQAHPDIDVELVNVGQGPDHYTQLRTTLTAGTGAPDVTQMEFKNTPGFVLTDSLVNLADHGVADLKDRFLPSAWSQVTVGDAIYGVPQDTGPMIMLYRPDIFEGLGLQVPTTWDEYIEAARRIKESDPDRFIASVDPGNAGGTMSSLWQAGSRPFALEGEATLTIDFQDDGAEKWAQTWNPLVAEGLVEITPGSTDEWYRGMADGRYATWLAGAWAPTFLQSVIPQTEGQWRVAPLPQYGPGEPVAAENGGSSVAVTTQSDCPEAAVQFAVWLNTDPAAARSLNQNSLLYPATTELAESREFLDATSAFLGGQQVNKVYVEASQNVPEGWQYTPFQDYAESVFPDTVGQAMAAGTDLGAGLQAWGERLRSYAAEQGFEVRGG